MLDMLDRFMMTIADDRFSDIAQKPDAPFISGGMYSGYMVNAMDVTLVQANARDGEALRAFDAMYTEVEKMIRFGFTQSEFDRAKTEIERQIQQEYDRRDDRRGGYRGGQGGYNRDNNRQGGGYSRDNRQGGYNRDNNNRQGGYNRAPRPAGQAPRPETKEGGSN